MLVDVRKANCHSAAIRFRHQRRKNRDQELLDFWMIQEVLLWRHSSI